MAAIDDFKAAETGAVTGDDHPLIPLLQTGGEGDFQELHYRHTHSEKRPRHMHALGELQSHAIHTHTQTGVEGVCFGECWRSK